MHTKSLFLLAILLLFAGCDKENQYFTTDNRFELSADWAELDVRTHEWAGITDVMVNGVRKRARHLPEAWSKPIRIPAESDSCCLYMMNAEYEIVGGWFSLTNPDDKTTHLSIAPNNSKKDRSLVITVAGRIKHMEIFVFQQGRKGNK